MNNDLIDRKLIYADDIYRYIKTEINPYGKPFEGSAYEFGLKIMEYIKNMSAAYDVEKVVEQIKHKGKEVCCSVKCNDNCNDCEHGCLMNAIIKSVRDGAI